jgi:hypothetical protein
MRGSSRSRLLGVLPAALALLLVAQPLPGQERPPPQERPVPAEDQAEDERRPAPPPVLRPPPPPAAAPRPARDTIPARDTAVAREAQAQEAARRAQELEADTIFQALRRLPGFTAMEYRGDSASFNAEQRVLRLFGASEVTRQGDRLTAEDTIVYREATRLVEAYGRPTISGQAETIEGNIMFYDLATRRATVRGGRTRVAEAGASWFVRGDVTAEGNDRIFATRSTFTTDDREEPAYHFEADNIKIIRDRILVGRPARLYFRNVPVFWLPFVAQDLTRGRRSGLLSPEFSINDIVRNQSVPPGARGTGRQISNLGFYWAINDYMDAQVSGGWRSGDFTSLRGALQYNWTRQFLQGNVSYQQFWREVDTQTNFSASSSWRPDERTSMSLSAVFVSTDLIREITTDYFAAQQDIQSNFSMNRRFDWGSVDFGASRRQSLANDQVDMQLPTLGINLQPITFLRAATPDQQRWYSNATFNPGGIRASRSTLRQGAPPVLATRRPQRDTDRMQINLGPSFSVGNFSISSGFNMNRAIFGELAPIDTFPGLPRFDEDRGSWNSSIAYRISLIGETSVSPNLALSQELRRDTLTGGALAQGPLRQSFGASVQTALYGFLPGFGGFSAIRHKLTPGFQYAYVPEVQLTDEQERIFGRQGGRMQNNLQLLSLNQTFEAKMRGEGRPPADIHRESVEQGDTLPDAGTGTQPLGTQAAPPQERKITLLSINTSGFNYDFAPDTLGRRVGFTTRDVTNTLSSDYLRGLQLTMSHELFDPSEVPIERRGTELGRFSPRLSGLSTQFSLGQDSPLLRWMGLFGRVAEAPPSTDSIPAQPRPRDPLDPTRSNAFTQNPQAVGRGPWRMDIGYTLRRSRDGGIGAHDLRLGSSFSPTPNWAVNWFTNYSIEDGSFGGHQITLRRDLYRWEANFNFSRTPFGNTSFDVLIRLKDLPDLKVDYREHNIGATRR